MPVYRSHKVLEVVQGIKAFLRLDICLVRGEVPDPERQLKAQERKLRQAHNRINQQSQELERAQKLLVLLGKQLYTTIVM